MPTVYLTVEQVLYARKLALEASDTVVVQGHANLGGVASILGHIENDEYYPTFEDKVAHLLFGLTKFHCFVDGNKRTAVAATLYMLLFNGHRDCARTFIHDIADVVINVAANLIDKDILKDIVCAMIDGTYAGDEVLKARILLAISPPPAGEPPGEN